MGLTTWIPSSTVPLHPVKLRIENGALAAQLAGLTDHTPESTRGHPVSPAVEMPSPPLTDCTTPFTCGAERVELRSTWAIAAAEKSNITSIRFINFILICSFLRSPKQQIGRASCRERV